jgi:hypothetical protein
MTRTFAAALTVLALTGCADMAADTCQSFGLAPGTEAFASCAQAEMQAMRAQYKDSMDFLEDTYATSQNQPSDQAEAQQ